MGTSRRGYYTLTGDEEPDEAHTEGRRREGGERRDDAYADGFSVGDSDSYDSGDESSYWSDDWGGVGSITDFYDAIDAFDGRNHGRSVRWGGDRRRGSSSEYGDRIGGDECGTQSVSVGVERLRLNPTSTACPMVSRTVSPRITPTSTNNLAMSPQVQETTGHLVVICLHRPNNSSRDTSSPKACTRPCN